MTAKNYLFALGVLAAVMVGTPAAFAGPPEGVRQKVERLGSTLGAGTQSTEARARNFKLLGHHDLGMEDSNGDVWVHGNFAYVGTWRDPCNGRGVKIVDVSDLHHPEVIGTLAAREGTSAEDMKVVSISTQFFSGDLIAVGIQRCGDDPEQDDDPFGLELWDVTNPYAPVKLSEIGMTTGGGGVHELDLFERGSQVYALVATPFSEWFDPVPKGEFRIVDVTNPRAPVEVSDWGAGANGFSRGPLWGQGTFGSMFGHSARASADGNTAYVSYWDLGVLTFDISDVANPELVTRTIFADRADGDAHSMVPYEVEGRELILQNDEDLDPRSPATISWSGGEGLGTETPGAPPLWLEPQHALEAPVVRAENEGCDVSDYPPNTPGRIAVVKTLFPFFDPGGGDEPACPQNEQEAAAEAAGARAVVHDFISEATSPQWFDFGEVGIPVLFTDHETAESIVAAGSATLRALRPSWGFLRVFDADTGQRVARFDGAPHVHELPAPDGTWSIHNTEVVCNRAYVSWYSNGVVALDLDPLAEDDVDNPKQVGYFVPTAGHGHMVHVWGVGIRPSDNAIFLSDMGSGLWIVKATDRAAPDGCEDGDD